jgi:hypothetical protein
MDYRVLGALLGFTLGASGFIIYRYWVKPIRHFRKLKQLVLKDISEFVHILSSDAPGNILAPARLKETRHRLTRLTDCFLTDIPSWYRIALKSRGVSPEAAFKHVTILSRLKSPDDALRRLCMVHNALESGTCRPESGLGDNNAR